MTRESGAKRIFLYNWPTYVGTWLGVVVVLCIAALWTPTRFAWALLFAAAVALLWSVLSLAVSHYIYDRSELSGGRWLRSLFPATVDSWIAIDAGLDAEIDLSTSMPGRCVARLDIFDPQVMHAGSVQRARRRTPRTQPATPSSPLELAVATGICDAALVVFTAHEIRDARMRELFFAELHRALRPGGRLLLVEHVRDLLNLAVFGPGFLHFLPRREWLRLANNAGFRLAVERRVTPWVVALVLEKA